MRRLPATFPLYVTPAECAERLGLSTNEFKQILPALEKRGFPQPTPLFSNRRYFPAVVQFLDWSHDIEPHDAHPKPGPYGVRDWTRRQQSSPSPDSDVYPLFVDDTEAARRIGIATRDWEGIASHFDARGLLTAGEPLLGGRRYWPSIRVFLDRLNDISGRMRVQWQETERSKERWD